MAKKKIKETDYLSFSAYFRGKEAQLLSRDRLDRILSDGGYAEACRAASDAGYPDLSELDVAGINAALEQRLEDEMAEVREMLPDAELMRLLCLEYDCHNAKVLVKSGGDLEKDASLFSDAGCYTPEELKAVYDDDAGTGSGALPADFAEAIRESKSALARTGNPQLADFILDKAYFALLLREAEATGRPFLVNWVRNRIDKVNLRSLLRTLGMSRREEALRNALVDGGNVALDELTDPSLTREDITKLYSITIFDRASEETGMTAYEKASDNAEMEYITSASLIPFGPEVALEYVTALQSEIVALRIILTGKRMGIGAETLRERLRESYV